MKHAFKQSRGFTLVEIIVALCIAALVYTSFSKIFRSSGHQIERGTRMLEMQTVLDALEHNIREDVRKLKKVEISTEGDHHRFSCQIFNKDQIQRIEYEFIAAEKGIIRRELSESAPEQKMLAAGHVEACVFDALIENGQFKRLDLALNLKVESNVEIAEQNLTVLAHFTSRCCEPYSPWLAAP